MKEMIITPQEINNDIIIQFSDDYIVEKNLVVDVPNQYEMIGYINGKVSFRENDGRYIIYKINKDFLKKNFKVAFIKKKALPDIIWGFGDINVNNQRLKECYRVGSNGTLQFEIIDRVKFVDSFIWGKNISVDMIKFKIIPVIKNIGADVLSKYFANTDVSVFEINSKLEDIRIQLFNSLSNELIIKNMGLKVKSLVVNIIHVNDDDLDIIRNHING